MSKQNNQNEQMQQQQQQQSVVRNGRIQEKKITILAQEKKMEQQQDRARSWRCIQDVKAIPGQKYIPQQMFENYIKNGAKGVVGKLFKGGTKNTYSYFYVVQFVNPQNKEKVERLQPKATIIPCDNLRTNIKDVQKQDTMLVDGPWVMGSINDNHNTQNLIETYTHKINTTNLDSIPTIGNKKMRIQKEKQILDQTTPAAFVLEKQCNYLQTHAYAFQMSQQDQDINRQKNEDQDIQKKERKRNWLFILEFTKRALDLQPEDLFRAYIDEGAKGVIGKLCTGNILDVFQYLYLVQFNKLQTNGLIQGICPEAQEIPILDLKETILSIQHFDSTLADGPWCMGQINDNRNTKDLIQTHTRQLPEKEIVFEGEISDSLPGQFDKNLLDENIKAINEESIKQENIKNNVPLKQIQRRRTSMVQYIGPRYAFWVYGDLESEKTEFIKVTRLPYLKSDKDIFWDCYENEIDVLIADVIKIDIRILKEILVELTQPFGRIRGKTKEGYLDLNYRYLWITSQYNFESVFGERAFDFDQKLYKLLLQQFIVIEAKKEDPQWIKNIPKLHSPGKCQENESEDSYSQVNSYADQLDVSVFTLNYIVSDLQESSQQNCGSEQEGEQQQ